jgi:hypothetical protein
MDRDDYRELRRNPRLRDAFQSVTGTRPPSRSQLEAALTDAGVSDHIIGDIVEDAAKLAQQVAAGSKPFHVRQEADARALHWLRKIETEDSLLGDLAVLVEDDDPEEGERGALAALARQRQGVIGNTDLRQTEPKPVAWSQQR